MALEMTEREEIDIMMSNEKISMKVLVISSKVNAGMHNALQHFLGTMPCSFILNIPFPIPPKEMYNNYNDYKIP